MNSRKTWYAFREIVEKKEKTEKKKEKKPFIDEIEKETYNIRDVESRTKT